MPFEGLERRREAQQLGREAARQGDLLHAAGCMLFWAEGSRDRNVDQVHELRSGDGRRSSSASFDAVSTFLDQRIAVTCNLFADHVEYQDEIEAVLARPPAVCHGVVLRKSTVNRFSKYSQKKRRNKLPIRNVPSQRLRHAARAAHLRGDPGVRRFRARGMAHVALERPTRPQSSGAVEERVVRFRPTTILALLGITIGVFLLLQLVWIAREVLTWVLIAVFLALAMNPAVNWFQAHGIRRRGLATGITAVLVLAGFALLGLLFIPTLVTRGERLRRGAPGLRRRHHSPARATRVPRVEVPRDRAGQGRDRGGGYHEGARPHRDGGGDHEGNHHGHRRHR